MKILKLLETHWGRLWWNSQQENLLIGRELFNTLLSIISDHDLLQLKQDVYCGSIKADLTKNRIIVCTGIEKTTLY